jgi:hypothetical protein
MNIKKFKNLMCRVKCKDFKDKEKSSAEAEELFRLIKDACSQLVEIYEYTKHDFRFKYDDVHYTVTLDRIDFESAPDKIHINRCVEGKFITRDIDMVELDYDAASKNLELMNEVITNWFRAKGVCR